MQAIERFHHGRGIIYGALAVFHCLFALPRQLAVHDPVVDLQIGQGLGIGFDAYATARLFVVALDVFLGGRHVVGLQRDEGDAGAHDVDGGEDGGELLDKTQQAGNCYNQNVKISRVDTIDLVVETIRREISPERIILFGSLSQGNAKSDSDLDIAVIQKKKARLGQKGRLYLALAKSGYDWRPEVDIHIFSKREFANRLETGDLFAVEVEKGRVIYQAGE